MLSPDPKPERLGLEFVTRAVVDAVDEFEASPVLLPPPMVLLLEFASPDVAF